MGTVQVKVGLEGSVAALLVERAGVERRSVSSMAALLLEAALGGVAELGVTGSAPGGGADTPSVGEDAAGVVLSPGASLPVPHLNAPSAFRPDPKPESKKK